MVWLVIRVRGGIHAHHSILTTFQELRLHRPNHATILPEDESVRGMLTRVQGYVTWGPVSADTVELLLKGRGKQHDGTPIPDAEAKKLSASASKDGLRSVATSMRPVLRLKAPTGGWKSTKKPFTMGGALGFRAAGKKDDMNALARRML